MQEFHTMYQYSRQHSTTLTVVCVYTTAIQCVVKIQCLSRVSVGSWFKLPDIRNLVVILDYLSRDMLLQWTVFFILIQYLVQFGHKYIFNVYFTENITVSEKLREISSVKNRLDPNAFLHKGPVYGINNGTYLVNATIIYLVDEKGTLIFQLGMLWVYCKD